jgi:anaerobic magnesium-protoporphyrin IX monomethyl ester cyclase
MERGVPNIKLVDRTFNYDATRAREIFAFILKHNRGSHFHFEIGAHLLDEATLKLLETVPDNMFQFEIGVQSTLPATLAAIGRKAPLDTLGENVRRLRRKGNIHLHLDLIAGLPGEGFADFLTSIDRVAALNPHHLQIEPVKLLPGAPLRQQAEQRHIRFDPNPPYTVLATPDLSFDELERLRGISRLCDLLCNSERFSGFLQGLAATCGSLSAGLETMEAYWRQAQLFRNPLSQRGVFEKVADFVQAAVAGKQQDELREMLARDFAHSERVVPGNAPDFFDTNLTEEEQTRLRQQVREEQDTIKGQGIKLQHFAAAFHHLPGQTGRSVLVFLYLTETGRGMRVIERALPLA